MRHQVPSGNSGIVEISLKHNLSFISKFSVLLPRSHQHRAGLGNREGQYVQTVEQPTRIEAVERTEPCA